MQRRMLLAVAVAITVLQDGLKAAPITVDELRGSVGDRTFKNFEKFVSSHLDKVIGLKISVEGAGNRTLSVSADGGQFVIYKSRETEREIVANSGYSWQHGSYIFDGFFLVKSGGMHQGIVSYGLEPVSEAMIRLNGNVRVRVINLN